MFDEEQRARFARALENCREHARARALLLIEVSTQATIARVGALTTPPDRVASLAALASRALLAIEREAVAGGSTEVLHEAPHDGESFLVTLVDERHALVAVFVASESSRGMVRFYLSELIHKTVLLLRLASSRQDDGGDPSGSGAKLRPGDPPRIPPRPHASGNDLGS